MSILAAFAVPHPPLIIPEVGRGEEESIQTTVNSYQSVMKECAKLQPETIVITSPHSIMYADYFHISPGDSARGNFGQFGASDVKIEAEYDTEFVRMLEKECKTADIPAGTSGEKNPSLDHATMIPLYFLNNEGGKNYKIVRIGLSGLSPSMHYNFGKLIAKTAEALNRKVVLIASGDLSHKLKADGPYGYSADGPIFDELCTQALSKGDFASLLTLDSDMCENAAECGLRSFWIMAGALDKKAVKSSLLSYEGPFGVGYGVASFAVTGNNEMRNCGGQAERIEKEKLSERKNTEDEYVKLARLSIETFVKTHRYVQMPKNLSSELAERKAGTFVSLKKHGTLRGCIGTTYPTQNSLAEEIIRNAAAACSEDPRFSPVREDELEELTYSVDVLGKSEPAQKEDLDVHRYGVIVSSGYKRGLLLPDLAGVDSVDQQIEIARKKGGISPAEPIKLERFEVVRHK